MKCTLSYLLILRALINKKAVTQTELLKQIGKQQYALLHRRIESLRKFGIDIGYKRIEGKRIYFLR